MASWKLPKAIRAVPDRLDQALGDGIDAAVMAKHRGRLARHGWADALDPVRNDRPAPELGWVARVPVRSGNAVEVLIDGHDAFPIIEQAIRSARRHVHIAGWHASPDFRLSDDGPALRDLLAETAERVPCRLLLWGGPPLPLFEPSRRHVHQDVAAFRAGSALECELDLREHTMHCHHEKLVIIDDEVAFVGGIDMTHLEGNRFDLSHHPKIDALGWHDVMTRLRGPVVTDVARHFTDRWLEVTGRALPEPVPCEPAGTLEVQLLRTVPDGIYGFAPDGDFGILAGYLQALRAAEHFIYLENQFLWSAEVAEVLADKLAHPPSDDFRVLLVLPLRPNSGRDTTCGQLGQLIAADDGRGRLLAVTLLGPTADSPGVYVHAKVGIVDDRWITIGSANLNEHSLYNDTEVNVALRDEPLARDTRLALWSEHLRLPVDEVDGPVTEVIDSVWRRQCDEQDPISAAGLDPIHGIRRIQGLSRRADRLLGPLTSLILDG